ncbi:MAG TPA: CsbD family protein [Methylophilaceae bacterium]|jgi:uncharacterized protein YjbJ (UPF0337 family)
MNWDRIQGNYKQFTGRVRETWGELTNDHMDIIEGRRKQLAGKIQELYGIGKDEADQQIKDFAKSVRRAAGTEPFNYEAD